MHDGRRGAPSTLTQSPALGDHVLGGSLMTLTPHVASWDTCAKALD